MGVIRQGILGGFSGKVANIVGSSWKGIAVMKSLPLSVANPRTAAQIAQRQKFANVVNFAVIILTGYIKPLWDRFAQRQSGFNAFISVNVDLFVNEAPAPFADFVLSRGRIGSVAASNVLIGSPATGISVEWPAANPENGLQSDLMYILAYNETKGSLLTSPNPGFEPRNNGDAGLNSDTVNEAGDVIHVWISARREDGTQVSDTGYYTQVL